MKNSKNMTVRVSFNQQTTAPLKNNGVLTEKPRRQYYWGRIALLIAAILIILITIIISFKHYFGEDEQPKSQPVVKDLTITSNGINSSEVTNTNSLNTNTTTALTNSSNQAPTTPIVEAPKVTTNTTVQNQDTAVEATPRSNGLFSQPNTTILSDNIKRFSLAPYMNGKEPAGDFSSLTFKNNITTIWAFSEAINLRNETLYYVWKLNGKQLAKVRVGVGADQWRSNSSKLVQKNMQGNWLVELQDSQGKVLANSKFTY